MESSVRAGEIKSGSKILRLNSMDRRELFSFLSSSISPKEESIAVRPPYFSEEESFEKCIECDGVCATKCPEKIIVIVEKKPQLDFSKRGCSYCDECANACEFDVLLLDEKRYVDCEVVINQSKCLSWQGVMCFSCKEPCLDDAIDFQAMFIPLINEKCTSCGFCIGRCPADAIDIKRRES